MFTHSELTARLTPIFVRFPAIQAVYLFGSVATGRVHAESDLDLAVVFAPSLASSKLDLLTELARHGFDNVDLVFLDRAGIVLRHEAVRRNCLVYMAPDFDRGAYYSRITREYLDFLPYLRVQREAYRWRKLHGTTGSDPQAVDAATIT